MVKKKGKNKMKKLMVAACAIAFAAIAQAAQYNWAIDADGEHSNTSTYYVFAGGSDIGSTIAGILSTDGASAFNDALASYNYSTGSLVNGLANGLMTGVSGNYSTVFFFDDGVIADKDFTYIVYDASSKIYTPPTSSPGALDMYGSDFGDPSYAYSWGNGTVAAVPEPTSGLLLLLGVAGLALKRRRA